MTPVAASDRLSEIEKLRPTVRRRPSRIYLAPRLSADQARVGLVGIEGEARIAGDHRQPAQPRKPVDQVLAQALADIVVDLVAGEIGEGQDGQRRPVVEAGGR